MSEEIDNIIKLLEKEEGKDFHTTPPSELEKLLRCDALVYGRVTK